MCVPELVARQTRDQGTSGDATSGRERWASWRQNESWENLQRPRRKSGPSHRIRVERENYSPVSESSQGTEMRRTYVRYDTTGVGSASGVLRPRQRPSPSNTPPHHPDRPADTKSLAVDISTRVCPPGVDPGEHKYASLPWIATTATTSRSADCILRLEL